MTSRFWAAAQAQWPELAPQLIVIAMTALVIVLGKGVYYVTGGYGYVLFVVSAACVAGACWRVTYAELHVAYRVTVRSLALILGVYAIFAYPSFDTHTHDASLVYACYALPWLAAAGAVLSWFRPVFGLVPALAVLAGKSLTQEILALPSLTRTDYFPVVELLIYMTLALAIARALVYSSQRGRMPDLRLSYASLSVTLFVTAVAIHFGNYFVSGMEKVLLDGGPLRWVTSNETQLLMEVAGRGGWLPIAGSADFAAWLHGVLSERYVLSNWAVLLSQLVCIVAILRTQWALWLTIFYDLTHIFIFVVSGIFFWKWILLNAVIVYGLARLRGLRPAVPLQGLCVGLIAFGSVVFFAAQLGWYDTRGFVHHYFEAVTRDGEVQRVPTNYFLAGSVSAAQNRLGTPSANHFPLGTWGNTQNDRVRAKAANCDLDDMLRQRYGFSDRFIQEFVRRHHAFVLARVDEAGRFPFDWYPHHIFSSPAAHRGFYGLDLRDVTAYRYVVESVCLDGEFATEGDRVMHRDELRIELR